MAGETTRRQTLTLQPKRPNLGDYFKPLINEAVRPALRAGGNIEGQVGEAIVALLATT